MVDDGEFNRGWRRSDPRGAAQPMTVMLSSWVKFAGLEELRTEDSIYK